MSLLILAEEEVFGEITGDDSCSQPLSNQRNWTCTLEEKLPFSQSEKFLFFPHTSPMVPSRLKQENESPSRLLTLGHADQTNLWFWCMDRSVALPQPSDWKGSAESPSSGEKNFCNKIKVSNSDQLYFSLCIQRAWAFFLQKSLLVKGQRRSRDARLRGLIDQWQSKLWSNLGSKSAVHLPTFWLPAQRLLSTQQA